MKPPQSDRVVSCSSDPATVFLSYRRGDGSLADGDAPEVARLEVELRARGIRTWRDVTSLKAGAYTVQEIVDAIERRVDAYLLYVSPKLFTSRFTWTYEIPAAARRFERDPDFPIIPVFRHAAHEAREVRIKQLRRACGRYRRRLAKNLADFAGEFVADDLETREARQSDLQAVAKRVLNRALARKLAREGAGAGYTPTVLFRTFAYRPDAQRLDLDVDWSGPFARGAPDPADWERTLLPALRDFRDAISEAPTGRTVTLHVQSHLCAALALGSELALVANFTLLLPWAGGTIRSDAPRVNQAPLKPVLTSASGDPRTAVVEVAITRDTQAAVTAVLDAQGVSLGYRLRLQPPERPGQHAVKTPAAVVDMARQVVQEIKDLQDGAGVSEVHLFVASPAPLAVLIGHGLYAVPRITGQVLICV